MIPEENFFRLNLYIPNLAPEYALKLECLGLYISLDLWGPYIYPKLEFYGCIYAQNWISEGFL